MQPGLACLQESIVGSSPVMTELRKCIFKYAQFDEPTLIVGETGTGKELVAEALHANSPRRPRQYIRVNCAAMNENLLESELFGHVKGAFTGAHRSHVGKFEVANGGTIFLDEVGDMSEAMQVKLLRTLETGEIHPVGQAEPRHVDVRVVTATHKNLLQAVANGQFREDLYYRLCSLSIEVPPLRAREMDILELAGILIEVTKTRLRGHGARGILNAASKRALLSHSWPGNVRELQNVVKRALIGSENLSSVNIKDYITEPERDTGSFQIRIPAGGVDMEVIEKEVILEALRQTGWVQKEAAALINISSRVMNYKVAKHNITHPRWSKNKEL